MDNELYVGRKLYEVEESRGRVGEIKEVVIKRIGNKYLYLENGYGREVPFNKNTLKYEDKDYSQHDRQLYFTYKEIIDNRRKAKLNSLIRDAFSGYSRREDITLDSLVKIAELIGIKENEDNKN